MSSEQEPRQTHSRPRLVYWLLPAALILLLLQVLLAQRPHPLEGEAAPPLEAPLLDGGSMDIAAHRGRDIVVLDFWATWCPPCRESLPEYEALARDYTERGVVVYAVNFMEPAEQVGAFLRQADVDLAVPLDVYGSLSRSFEVSSFPTSMIIDRDGIIDTVFEGYSPAVIRELRERLDTLLTFR